MTPRTSSRLHSKPPPTSLPGPTPPGMAMLVAAALSRGLRNAAVGGLVVKLAVLAVNAVAFPTLRVRPGPASRLRASILVPARNEAANLPQTLPPLLAQGAHEVIVLDDRSEDGTGELARQLGASVLDGRELPSGWLGKPWACQQLARAASGDVLIFTDADVTWRPGALAAILAEREERGAEMLSVWPRQEARGLGERLTTPMIDNVLLTLLPAPLVRLAPPSLSAASGQLIAFHRSPYWRVGGHALVQGEVLEDVRFAWRFKAHGGLLSVALGGDLMQVRMYRSYGEARQGFAKSLRTVHGDSRLLLLASWLWLWRAYSWPLLMAARPGHHADRLLLLLGLLERLALNLKVGRTRPADLAEVFLTPLMPLAALPIYRQTLGRHYRWKGRTYDRQEGGRRD